MTTNYTALEEIFKIVLKYEMNAGEAMKIFTACLFSSYKSCGYTKEDAKEQALKSVDALYE